MNDYLMRTLSAIASDGRVIKSEPAYLTAFHHPYHNPYQYCPPSPYMYELKATPPFTAVTTPTFATDVTKVTTTEEVTVADDESDAAAACNNDQEGDVPEERAASVVSPTTNQRSDNEETPPHRLPSAVSESPTNESNGRRPAFLDRPPSPPKIFTFSHPVSPQTSSSDQYSYCPPAFNHFPVTSGSSLVDDFAASWGSLLAAANLVHARQSVQENMTAAALASASPSSAVVRPQPLSHLHHHTNNQSPSPNHQPPPTNHTPNNGQHCTPASPTFTPSPAGGRFGANQEPNAGNCGAGGAMDNNITLWQFLLELLMGAEHQHLIQWTGASDGEFKLLDHEGVAQLWGRRKNKPNMNYDKLSRALRYYYDKNIIKKVVGQKFVYRFVQMPDTSQQALYDYLRDRHPMHAAAAHQAALPFSLSGYGAGGGVPPSPTMVNLLRGQPPAHHQQHHHNPFLPTSLRLPSASSLPSTSSPSRFCSSTSSVFTQSAKQQQQPQKATSQSPDSTVKEHHAGGLGDKTTAAPMAGEQLACCSDVKSDGGSSVKSEGGSTSSMGATDSGIGRTSTPHSATNDDDHRPDSHHSADAGRHSAASSTGSPLPPNAVDVVSSAGTAQHHQTSVIAYGNSSSSSPSMMSRKRRLVPTVSSASSSSSSRQPAKPKPIPPNLNLAAVHQLTSALANQQQQSSTPPSVSSSAAAALSYQQHFFQQQYLAAAAAQSSSPLAGAHAASSPLLTPQLHHMMAAAQLSSASPFAAAHSFGVSASSPFSFSNVNNNNTAKYAALGAGGAAGGSTTAFGQLTPSSSTATAFQFPPSAALASPTIQSLMSSPTFLFGAAFGAAMTNGRLGGGAAGQHPSGFFNAHQAAMAAAVAAGGRMPDDSPPGALKTPMLPPMTAVTDNN